MNIHNVAQVKTIAGKQKGFAMLFSVLVSSVLLSIGLSIFNITLKELVLSASGRESQFAFYAADTGTECALYWDFQTGANTFATSTYDPVRDPAAPQCIGQAISIDNFPSGRTNTSALTQFSLDIPSASPKYCVTVSVNKTAPDPYGIITTIIESRGYNNPCGVVDTNTIERAIRVQY